MKTSVQTYLRKLYSDPTQAGSLGGVERLYRQVKKDGVFKITRKKLKGWLRSNRAYTLHRVAHKSYSRLQVLASEPDSHWQADLLDYSNISRYNNNNKYILTVIDVFSRFAWVRPLKTKSGCEVTHAFKSILHQGRRQPEKLQTDRGKEFLNVHFSKILHEWNITLYHTNSKVKAALAERFNRTLSARIGRYLTAHNTRKYVDVLQDLCASYNRSFHRSIQMRPIDVSGEERIQQIKLRFSGLHNVGRKSEKPKFKPNDLVRISKNRMHFEKSNIPSWSEEIFTIQEQKHSDPRTYKLTDYNGEMLEGLFYDSELQKVTQPTKYLIERIVKTKRSKKGLHYFVKWLGYPDEFNSWVTDVEQV